ncbi:helix-turn-helix domain-containing protein (plasmid) [Glutamicibacter sp. FR1]|uniref:helix-turn-helix domain-containing protein n=1 Tax=Glutamicibacter sp. FR1 TaxID=3393744 RepID=UPI0039AFC609
MDYLQVLRYCEFMARFDTAEQVMVGLVHQQRPSTGKEISKATKIPAATVNRTLLELIDRGFVERWNAYSPGEPLHPKRSQVTINFRRPSITQFLDYLHVEHGADYGPFQKWDENARDWRSYSAHRRGSDEAPQDPYLEVDSHLAFLQDQSLPFADQQRRVLESNIAQVLTQVFQAESYFQDIYSEVKEEQARSLVHNLMGLAERLSMLRPDSELQDERDSLSALAITAVWCFRTAEELWDFTQVLWESGTALRAARQIRYSLANAFIDSYVPSHEKNFSAYTAKSEVLIPIAEGLWADQLIRDAHAQLTYPTTGDAGDILLAVQFHQYAMKLYDLAQEIRLMPPFNELGLHMPPLPPSHKSFQRFFARKPGESDEDYSGRFKESWAQYKLKDQPQFVQLRSGEFRTKDLPDTTGPLWRKVELPVESLRAGDIMTHARGTELLHPILITETEDETVTFTLGHGYNVPFNKQWLMQHGEVTVQREGN